MKNKQLIIQLFALGALILNFCACAEDSVDKGNENNNNGGVKPIQGSEFRGYIDSIAWHEGEKESLVASAHTRMTGFYGKLKDNVRKGIRFYFDQTEDNQYTSAGNYPLFVNLGTDASPVWQYYPNSGTMTVLETDPVTNGVTKASWVGSQKLNKEKYKIRYGRYANSNQSLIQTPQVQLEPGKASNLRQYGDYATADAEDNGEYYAFVLKHHSAYITFFPYAGAGDSQTALMNCKLLKVRITSDQNMGSVSFPVNDAGYNITSWPTWGQKYIDLNCTDNINQPSTVNYSIKGNKADAENAGGAIMVLAPGTYTNVKIEYVLWDPAVDTYAVFTKTTPSMTLASGKNFQVFSSLICKDYTSQYFNTYHMWGATDYYWNASRPAPHNWNKTGNVGASSNVPQIGSPSYYNAVNANAQGTVDAPAGSLDYNAPTVNLYAWYIEKGDPRYDNYPFTYDGHLFNGRLWFKRASVIASENGTTVAQMSAASSMYNDISISSSSWLYNVFPPSWSEVQESERHKYFFILPLGGYINGSLTGMTRGSNSSQYIFTAYWSSTAYYNSTNVSWAIMANLRYNYSTMSLNSANLWLNSTYGSSDALGSTRSYRYTGLPKWPGEVHTYANP